jgi:MYXO-CTERM domain-containing protein
MSVRPQVGFIVSGLALLLARSASATVVQPSGETMPQPSSAAEINVVTSRGFAPDADTLAGIFKYHLLNGLAGGDITIDPTLDAHITPGTFSPQCGLTGTIVNHGGSCKNGLGWYNATEPATMPTTIYPLVPADLTQPPMSCADNDFCPLATRATTQAPQHSWADPLPEFAAAIRTSPNWKGGLVGFALIGVAGTLCTQTKYSQAELNDHSPAGPPTNGAPWVTTLIYQSVADPNAYYIAFEDLPTCATSWKGCNSGMANDGDFNDFVFYVSGLSCKDGGQPCTVPGQMGICAGGVTQCAAGGTTTTCKQAVMPQPEVCDNVDNDCNGMVDDNAPCPTPGFVCSQGVCVHPCDDNSEFKCVPGLKCDTDGLCKDPRCIGVTCGTDQICVAGTCIGGCDGVTCPHGQVCRTGACTDPCAGVTCDTGTVCEDGACQPPCGDCRDCASGKSCSTTDPTKGVCFETGCQNKTCPAGQVCNQGNCQDGCTGVVCPGGQACMDGSCTPVPMPDAGAPPPPPVDASTSGSAGTTGGTGTAGHPGTGTAGTTGGTAGTNGAGGDTGGHIAGVTTCKCDTAEGPGPAGVALLLGVLAIAAARRRDRAAVRAGRSTKRRA